MKTLVYYPHTKKADLFESVRNLKNIRDALEMADVPHTSIPVDNYEVAHLVTPFVDNKINELFESNIPTIISAFYSETDPYYPFLDETIAKNEKTTSIKNKDIQFLNKASLILVPNEESREILKEMGVTVESKAVVPGVNTARFDFADEDEKEIFYRYFKEDHERQIVVAIGEIGNEIDGWSAFVDAAKKSPKASFYYFAVGKLDKKLSYFKRAKISSGPKNAHLYVNIPSDVYFSALLNCSVFMLPGHATPSMTNVMDAMAAKCQIISRKQKVLEQYVINEETGYTAEYSETLGILIREYLNGEIKPTIDNAYEFAKQHSLEVFGNELKEIYNQLKEKIAGR